MDGQRQEAERQAESQGHRLGAWETYPSGDYAECVYCDTSAVARRSGSLTGPALVVACPRVAFLRSGESSPAETPSGCAASKNL